MKLFNINTFKLLILLVIGSVLVTQTDLVGNFIYPRSASAVGDLTVDWGIGFGDVGPIFTVNNMAPGDSEARMVTIKNNSTTTRSVAVKGVLTDETGNVADVLTISFLEGSTTLYTASLTQFFTDSLNNEGIELLTLNSQEKTTLTIEVKFQNEAGNPYQDKTVTFNLVFGIATNIPSACEGIDLKGRFPIYGTDGNDKLYGTAKDDVIIGFAGNDKIYGGSGNDCLIGGAGNDILEGDSGNDIQIGDEGDDKLNGSSGNDNLIGGSGNDRAEGSSGKDKCDAEKEVSCEL